MNVEHAYRLSFFGLLGTSAVLAHLGRIKKLRARNALDLPWRQRCRGFRRRSLLQNNRHEAFGLHFQRGSPGKPSGAANDAAGSAFDYSAR